jgi:hypothetical protein
MFARIRSDLEANYDKDLRDRRLNAYTALWALSEPLARYSPPEPMTARGARRLSERLRSWYFRHGIVLSGTARKAYFALQEALTAPTLAASAASTEPLDPGQVKALHDASTELHKRLSRDVGSRRPPMIADGPKTRGRLAWLRSPSGNGTRPPEGPSEAPALAPGGADD